MGMIETPLPDLMILLTAAVAIVAGFRTLRLSPVLGYLVAGMLIGPGGLKLVHESENMDAIAEFGIVFLLFMIGLDLSWNKLKTMRSQVFVIGSAQVIITAMAFAGVAYALGVNPLGSIIIGFGLALSSTALVLQVLESRGELAGQTGRLSLAILILQDIAVLPLLVLLPILATGVGSIGEQLSIAGIRALIALCAIAIVGRFLLRPLFRAVARLDIDELFVATTLLVVFGMAWATEAAGLSSALGAFIAGLLIAETEFQHQIEADVKPYKSLLMGLFFMTIGMKINADFLSAHALEVLFWAVGILGIKSVILFVLLRLRKFTRRTSIHVALLMAQGGEFGFILFALAEQLGLLPKTLSESLLVAITVSMAVTPLLDSLGALIERRGWYRVRMAPEMVAQETADVAGHVVLAGFGSMGQLIGEFLTTEKIPFVALDTNPRDVAQGRRKQQPVFYGDATRPEVLQSIGVARARAVIITLHEPEKAQAMLVTIRQNHPDLPILVRAGNLEQAKHLQSLGATLAVPELQVASKRLIAGLLASLNRPEEEIQRALEVLRS
jgi:CPA2 family monovalent cation:H+ antiporter-2